jgi:hypothetical protein
MNSFFEQLGQPWGSSFDPCQKLEFGCAGKQYSMANPLQGLGCQLATVPVE